MYQIPLSHVYMESIDLKSAAGTDWTDEKEKLTVDKIDFQFVQVSRLRGIYRKLTIFNGSQCYEEIQNRHKRHYKYRIDLAYLNPRPFRMRHIAWKWLYAALGLTLIGALLIYVTWFANWIEPSNYFLIFLVVEVSATLICLLMFFYKTYDRIIFRSQYGRVKFIEVLNGYPNKKSFRKFIGRFILHINKAKTDKGYSQSDFLAQELVELRRLKDETVISEENYNKAKTLILKNKAFTG